jgi:hypothetical protein
VPFFDFFTPEFHIIKKRAVQAPAVPERLPGAMLEIKEETNAPKIHLLEKQYKLFTYILYHFFVLRLSFFVIFQQEFYILTR